MCFHNEDNVDDKKLHINIRSVNSSLVMLMRPGCTRMEAVAGDVGALQPLGEFVGEEDVAQFAVAVLLEDLIVAVA